jgi:hypothetical protein
LAASWHKWVNQYSQWHTSLAAIALRAVGKHAAAPKTLRHQLRIRVIANQITRRRHLRTRLPVVQIAARVFRSRVKLQRLRGQVFELRHGVLIGFGFGFSLQ